jgi:uncharacterized cupin superfamily protein
MQIYRQGTKIDGLKPAGFLRAANATFLGPEAHDVIRLDGGNLSGPWAIGIWGVERGEFELTYGASEFVTILEGRVIVTKDGMSEELKAGDSFFTQKGETVRWKVLEELKKSFIVVI